jgi:hypothetical protein
MLDLLLLNQTITEDKESKKEKEKGKIEKEKSRLRNVSMLHCPRTIIS